jgi:hypothetical protein
MYFYSEDSGTDTQDEDHDDQLDVSILLTCKQLHEEASSVLHRVRTAIIYVTPDSRCFGGNSEEDSEVFGYGLEDEDINTFCDFRKVHVVIRNWSSYGQTSKNGRPIPEIVGSMLSEWADLLVKEVEEGNIKVKKEINLEFSFEGSDLELKADGRVTIEWARLLWFRVQAANVVKKMREELASRLPNMTVTLTSNVESGILQVDTVRENSRRVRFHIHSTGEKGVLQLPSGPSNVDVVFDQDSSVTVLKSKFKSQTILDGISRLTT